MPIEIEQCLTYTLHKALSLSATTVKPWEMRPNTLGVIDDPVRGGSYNGLIVLKVYLCLIALNRTNVCWDNVRESAGPQFDIRLLLPSSAITIVTK